ncbi:hypothetical protein D3C72_1783780 [compost metagenome]
MPGPHDQRRLGEPGGGGRNDGIAPAVRVEHVEAAFFQDAPDGRHAFQVIDGALHADGMDLEAGIAQAFRQLRLRLTDRFKMVTARPHGGHFLEYSSFLAAKAGGRFRVHDAQTRH